MRVFNKLNFPHWKKRTFSSNSAKKKRLLVGSESNLGLSSIDGELWIAGEFQGGKSGKSCWSSFHSQSVFVSRETKMRLQSLLSSFVCLLFINTSSGYYWQGSGDIGTFYILRPKFMLSGKGNDCFLIRGYFLLCLILYRYIPV